MRLRWFGLAVSVAPVMSCVAEAAPFTNKTIVVQWVATGEANRPGERTRPFNNSITRTFYVSSAGRIFARNDRKVLGRRNGRSDRTEAAPEQTTTREGKAIQARLVGNRLIQQAEMTEGAVQVVVDFDPSFTSCSAAVTYGKAGAGPIRQRGIGGDITMTSINVSSVSCRVADRNPFG